MAKKTNKTTSKKVANKPSSKPLVDAFGFTTQTWIETATSGSPEGARILVFGSRLKWPQIESKLKKQLDPQQLKALDANKPSMVLTSQGPLWCLPLGEKKPGRRDELPKSSTSRSRDFAGSIVPQIRQMTKSFELKSIAVEFHQTSPDEEVGFWAGLEIGAYSFKKVYFKKPEPLPQLHYSGGKAAKDHLLSAATQAAAVNLARHLVNLPPNDLHPESYANLVDRIFSGTPGVEVDIWEGDKLKKEDLNLLSAVGGGAAHGPRLVVLKWRPAKAGKKPPVAIVGKGITFDSGGLDIKPSAGMRLMKKDMGGSAAAVGIFHWAVQSKLPVSLDVYLSLAENAVDGRSFHPSDIIQTRAGISIEIHNTDAEGRLVLADAMTIAAESQPAVLVDLATLTGAIKVALGAEVSGLFCNHDPLAAQLEAAFQEAGEATWRMPLYPPYKNMLRSHFADHANASDGFAGAITAALFLEFFAKGLPWAHFDIYSWKDSADGALTETGGSGQAVLGMSRWLSRLAKRK